MEADGRRDSARRLDAIYKALENPDLKLLLDTRVVEKKNAALMAVVDSEITSLADLVQHFINLGALRQLHLLEKELVDLVQELQLDLKGENPTEPNPTESQPEVP
jgi:RNA polymerase-interacting CarD/CdnL/TRCF family regulator